jgi:hypothetical protein
MATSFPSLGSPALLVGALLLSACGDDTGGTGSGGGGDGGASSSPTASSSGAGGDPASSSGNSSGSGTSTSTGQGAGSSTSTGDATTATSTGSGSCTPDCADRVCGDDGCEGSCGECGDEQACSPGGQCIDVDPGAMSFFVTSVGNLSGDFGGLDGADVYCQSLAEEAGAGDRTWRAYLSTTSVHARDRIGTGPWYDAAGVLVARDVASLHADGILLGSALDEYGEDVPNGVTAPGMNEHDILTGSEQDGTFSGASCADWTSDSGDDSATAGHCDASSDSAGSTSPVDPSDNWNSSHDTNGCNERELDGTGSTARIYCFAE